LVRVLERRELFKVEVTERTQGLVHEHSNQLVGTLPCVGVLNAPARVLLEGRHVTRAVDLYAPVALGPDPIEQVLDTIDREHVDLVL